MFVHIVSKYCISCYIRSKERVPFDWVTSRIDLSCAIRKIKTCCIGSKLKKGEGKIASWVVALWRASIDFHARLVSHVSSSSIWISTPPIDSRPTSPSSWHFSTLFPPPYSLLFLFLFFFFSKYLSKLFLSLSVVFSPSSLFLRLLYLLIKKKMWRNEGERENRNFHHLWRWPDSLGSEMGRDENFIF